MVDGPTAHTGSRSMRVIGYRAAAVPSNRKVRHYAISASGGTYTIAFWARVDATEALTREVDISARMFSGDKWPGFHNETIVLDSTDWKEYTDTFVVPLHTSSYIYVGLAIGHSALDFWIDDFRFFEGEPADEIRTKLDLDLSEGWNMVSCPGDPVISDIATIVDGTPVLPDAYSWSPTSQAYELADIFEFGVGYWFVTAEDTQLIIEYQPRSTLTCEMKEGWSMLGSVSGSVPVVNLTSDPSGVVLLESITIWDSVAQDYVLVDEIVPGGAYWVGATQSCELTIDSATAAVQSGMTGED